MRKTTRRATAAAITMAIAGVANHSYGQLVAFPGAQGFGKDTVGGRNGSLYVVTNLNASGPGSFANGVGSSNKIIVFAVGGTILLTSSISAKSNITVLGQTAPGNGIAIEGYELSFSDQANVDLQYIRVREGTPDANTSQAAINLGDLNGGILDHVSAELSSYDNIDAVGANSQADNITYQNDLLADGIHPQYFNIHEEGTQVTFLNDVFANSNGRSPLVKANDNFVDNVAYDYEYAYTTGNSAGVFKYDIVNNYFIPGPTTIANNDQNQAFFQLDNNQSAYASGNLLNTTPGTLGGTTVVPESSTSINSLSSEWSPETQFLPTVSATAAFYFDTTHSGDSVVNPIDANGLPSGPPELGYDQLDTLIMQQVQSVGTLGKVFNEPDDDGMAGPLYFGTTNGGSWTFVSSAGDDIPDTWAVAHGMNPTSFAAATFKNALGYDMIEEYAQQLGDTYNTQVWTNASGDWTTGTWSATTPGDYDHVLISGGGSVSLNFGDLASAFSISIGGSGNEALNVNGGNLYVQDTIYVGQLSNGGFNMSGGTVMCNNVQLGNTVWDVNGNPTNFTGTFNFTGGTLEVGQIVNGTGNPNNWTGGGNWFWSGGIVEAWGNLNINAAATLGIGGAIVNTVGPDGVTYTGLISGAMSGTGSFTKIGAGSLTLSAQNTYTGSTTLLGGQLDITGSLANNGPSSVFIAADSTGLTKLKWTSPAGASYDGYGSSVTSGLLSSGQLLQGVNSTNNTSGETITMGWRLRLSSEMPPNIKGGGLVSEVLTLTGMANTGTTGNGQSDPYALEMSFNPAFPTTDGTLGTLASEGQVELGYLNSSSVWLPAVQGNFLTGLNGDVFTDVQSSWAVFALTEGITDANIGNYLGSWGVDSVNGQAWAVLDHNSTFAADLLPEPSAAGIFVAAAGGLMLMRRRRRRRMA
jgi:autotransporter-associated beta strand protein